MKRNCTQQAIPGVIDMRILWGSAEGWNCLGPDPQRFSLNKK